MTSYLIAPRTRYTGWDRVLQHLQRLAEGSLRVLDDELDDARFLTGATGGDAAFLDGICPDRGRSASGSEIVAFHTSGSTGSPTCVVYRRAEVARHAATVARVLRLRADTAYAALPSPRFAYGLSILTSHRAAGVPVRFVEPRLGLPLAPPADGRPLTVYALPQHAPFLLSSTLKPDALHHLLIAGGRLSQASATALLRRFPAMRLTIMYGQAEMGPRLALWEGAPGDYVEGVIGRPIPGVDLDVTPTGHLLARSDHAMTWAIPAPYEHLEQFAGRHEQVRTGDLATRLPNGTYRHDGRADHVINVAGSTVDVRRVVAVVEAATAPLLVQVGSRPARTAERVPVVEIVPDGTPTVDVVTVRRALHTEFGGLAALFDIRYVETPTVKESGK